MEVKQLVKRFFVMDREKLQNKQKNQSDEAFYVRSMVEL